MVSAAGVWAAVVVVLLGVWQPPTTEAAAAPHSCCRRGRFAAVALGFIGVRGAARPHLHIQTYVTAPVYLMLQRQYIILISLPVKFRKTFNNDYFSRVFWRGVITAITTEAVAGVAVVDAVDVGVGVADVAVDVGGVAAVIMGGGEGVWTR